jgi:GGDEF domain-containing protein
LDEKNHDGSQPYQISASCGYVVTDPVSDMALQDYVQEADRMMYEIKKQVHAKDGAAGR